MRDAAPAAVRIDTLVNTHADGDHTWGNQLAAGAEIIGHVTLAEDFAAVTPAIIMDVLQNRERYGPGAQMLYEEIGLEYRFDDILLTPPTRTFEHELRIKVGDRDVHLRHVGPAHSRADTLVWVPQDRVVYTGDILFVGVHPTIWSGPVSNWLKACALMLAWDVDVVVPGHGPITDKDGIRRLQQYLGYVYDETRKGFDAGLGYYEAACDIALGGYADWVAPERIVCNVAYLYREFGADQVPDPHQVQNDMARYRARRG
jgi:cyclase